MQKFIIRRLLMFFPMMLILTMLVFVLMRVVPGGPLDQLDPGTDPAFQEDLRAQYGLDRNILVQYGVWLKGAVQGDLGKMIRSRLPVMDDIKPRIPVTFELGLISIFITFLVGVPIGVLSAVKKNSIFDIIASVFAFLAVSIPNFWLGLMLILLFALVLGWLPAIGFVPFREDPLANLKGMILPAIALGTGGLAIVIRLTRSGMIEVLNQEYVMVARSKGLAERVVIFRHALRNAMLPVVTVFGLVLGRLFGGSVVVESVFGMPGMGKFIINSIGQREYTALQAAIVIIVLGVLLSNLLVDILYSYLDPRIRQQG